MQHVKTKLVTVASTFTEKAEKEITSAICWDSRVSAGKPFEIYRCQSETYEPVFSAGDLGTVDCGGDLLSQRKQALCILSGVVIRRLVWPASRVGE